MLDKNEIEHYILGLRTDELEFSVLSANIVEVDSTFTSSLRAKIDSVFFILASLMDFVELKFKLLFKNYRNKRIVYTSANFTTSANGVVEDRIMKPLFTENILYINQSKEVFMHKINNQKVYNVGGLAKIIAFFSKEPNIVMRIFIGHQKVNKWLLNGFSNKEVYLMFYYELNSLSIILSDFRHKLKLIEIQHGSIINYSPYSKPAPVKVIDLFYVRNNQTMEYLENHLCTNFKTEYKLIPYPRNTKIYKKGIHILYASTVEFKGLHPVFIHFLKSTPLKNLNVNIRLHPRERNLLTEEIFIKQMNLLDVSFKFDKSNNWLEHFNIANLIVISPWSSIIEEAVDNGFTTIIIDEVGKKRYSNYLTDSNCIFSKDLINNIVDDSFNT